MNKNIDNCQLAEDAKSPEAYYNINRKKKRDWHWCPRCNQRSVNKIYRTCDNCHGRLHWDGDDCRESDREMSYWFLWHTNLAGVAGWYSKDYWVGGFA